MSLKVEQSKNIKKCPSFPNYGATEEGDIFRLSSGKKMKPYIKKDGYLDIRVCHNNKPQSVKAHVMVADAWLEKEENKPFINHKNGIKSDNRVENLERCSGAENQRHAVSMGLKGSLEDLYNSKFTNEEVHEICKLLMENLTVKSIADRFGVTVDNIRKIKDGSCYFGIRKLYPDIPHQFKNSFSESTVRWVCERVCEGIADKVIANNSSNEKLSCDEVKRIRHKIRYTSISDEYF